MELPDYLELDLDSEIRIKGHRIRLIDIAARYEEGHSAESIVLDHYPTLELSVVYKTIGFYLENQTEVKSRLERNQKELERQMAQAPTTPTLSELRRRMEAKRREAS